jgi:pyrimidine operon attenuation protein/uracil phosphoribosyltransferase
MSSRPPDAERAYATLLAQLSAAGLASSRIVGIHSGGVWVAQRLAHDLGQKDAPGELDISFYRDDFDRIGLHAAVNPTQIAFEVEGAHIILVDDVLYTGRTIRGALNVLFDYGRPARVELAVLADRGNRELPIAARYSGGSVEVPHGQELVLVRHGDAPTAARFEFEWRDLPAAVPPGAAT